MALTEALDSIDMEYRLVQECGVFTKDELSALKKTRIDFERQLVGSTEIPLTTLNGYLDHIYNYAQTVQNRLKDVKGKSLPSIFFENLLLKLKGLNEVRVTLYGEQDPNLLAKYLQFCCGYQMSNEAKMYLQMQFPHNIKMWIFAAKFLIKDDCHSMLAVDFLLAALNINKGDEKLYIEILKIELDTAAKSTRNVYLEKCTKRLIELLSNLFKEEHSEEYHIHILGIIVQYSFATALKQAYSEQIIIHFPNTAGIWHSLAQCEILGDSHRIMGRIENTCSTASLLNTKFLACLEIYKEGLDKVSDLNKPQLWILYINFLININTDPSCEFDKDLKYQSLKAAFKNGCNYIKEDQYLAWLKHLNRGSTLELIKLAVSAYPTSAKLWRAWMHYESLDDNLDALTVVFHQGRSLVKENSLPLWEFYIAFNILLFGPPTKIESIYEEGIKEHPNISGELKARYVEWLAMSKGISAARDLYLRIADLPPYSKQLHFKMLELEKFQVPNDFDFMEKINQLATFQFKEDLEIWLKYIKFKVNSFYFKYRDEHASHYLSELKLNLKEVCKLAKSALPVNMYAELKYYSLEQLQFSD